MGNVQPAPKRFSHLLFIASWGLSCVCCSAFAGKPSDDHRVSSNQLLVTKGREYQLQYPAFSDYAGKFRSIFVPTGAEIEVGDGKLRYPEGTRLTKSFYLFAIPGQECSNSHGTIVAQYWDQRTMERPPAARLCMLETRTLTLTHGRWEPSVVARSAQFANTVLLTGAEIPVVLQRNPDQNIQFNYQIPSIGDCKICHEVTVNGKIELAPIGPSLARRIDGKLLEYFVTNGSITPEMAKQMSNNRPTIDPARGYLDINCEFCHNPLGYAASSGLFLGSDITESTQLGVCKRPVIRRDYSGKLFDIKPGEPDASVLMARINTTLPVLKMPEIGRHTIDYYGVGLIAKWISSLQGSCND